MSKPLMPGDPGEVGPFRLDGRLHESPAGIVYRGADAQGRPVSVALLTTAAADDAAARDRFRAAITREMPGEDPVPRPPAAPGPRDPSPVLAALTQGGAPWVATAHEEGRAGAERFLEPVLLRRGWGIRGRRGPQFQPYWASGPSGPALRAEEAPAAAPRRPGDARGLATAVLSLAALLSLLVLLLVLLFSCEPKEPAVPPPVESPTLVPTTPSPSPSTTSARPRPSPSRTSGTPTSPRPSDGGRDVTNPPDLP